MAGACSEVLGDHRHDAVPPVSGPPRSGLMASLVVVDGDLHLPPEEAALC
jgi:hypothetical protein